ncbi:MAG: hypothetical protein GC154_17005 [bacterium]|nr:hypothetical protein [bacterium]
MPPKPAPIISELESAIMAILWDEGEATAVEIIPKIQSAGFQIGNSALRTVFARMETKGLIEKVTVEKLVGYAPRVERNEVTANTPSGKSKSSFFSALTWGCSWHWFRAKTSIVIRWPQ